MLLDFAPLWLGLKKQLLKMELMERAKLVVMKLHAQQLRMASVMVMWYWQEAVLLRTGELWWEAVLLRTGGLWQELVLLRTGHLWRERAAPVQDAGA